MYKPDNEPETHPSYGRIRISRVTGGNRALFASSILHGNTMRISISKACIERNLNTDWIYDREELIEVEMSHIQFAELITDSSGPGTPCTILHIDGKAAPRCETVNKKEQQRNDFSEMIKKISDCMNEMGETLNELKNAKSVSKSNIKELSGMFDMIRQKIKSDMPFAAACFDEQMERSVLEAKGEVEAHILHQALRFAEDGMKLVHNLNDKPSLPSIESGETFE